jgi:hypothetical protein
MQRFRFNYGQTCKYPAMKNISLLLSACVLITASCSKSHTSPDNGCIERLVLKQSDPLLAPSQMHSADSLFDANHIDHSNFRYLLYSSGSVNGHLEQNVPVDQYLNGLRLFNSHITYQFFDGVLDPSIYTWQPRPSLGTTLDTVPHLTLPRLRALFTRDLNAHKGYVSPGVTDSCYQAEFGYYNTAVNPAPESLVKAWLVTVKKLGSGLTFGFPPSEPYAIYSDSDEKLIAFSGYVISID